MNNSTLTAIFAAVGRRNGYEETTAEFAAFRDFKIKWTRSPKWISFEVSDYLADAPEKVLASLAETIFGRIRDDASPYPDDVRRWITSDDFVHTKQPIFIRRFRGLSRTTEGSEVDLAESYERLVDRGLVERDPDLFIAWAPPNTSSRAGKASVLMKVVVMSSRLDDRCVPKDLLDYCLYAQIAYISMGFNPTLTRRGAEYDELLSRYPGRRALEDQLSRMQMSL